jgi:AraC family transcriptional regulator
LEKMNSARISESPKRNRELLPHVLEYGKTAGGLALLLRSDPAGVLEVPELPDLLVAIHVGRSSKIYCRRGGHSHCGTAVHGDIDIIPPNTSSRWEMMDENDTALLLSLPSALLNTVAEEYGFDPRRVEIRNRFQVRDAQIENICWALKTEMEADYPSGPLYVDSLAMSVASRLVTCHSSIAKSATERRRGLRGRQLKDVLSYIDDHLAEDMPLSKIASIAGVSTSYLKALFRESAGMPVHQYLIRRRVERAKTLLAEGKLPIAEIALAAGFAHQSHLARHMRRILGTSPRTMRQIAAGRRSADKK